MSRTRRARWGLAAIVAAGLTLAPASVAPLPGPTVASAAGGCPTGWSRATESTGLALQDVLKLPGDNAIAVGSDRRSAGDRRWAISRWDGGGWRTTLGSLGMDGALLGVSGTPPGRLWAVGFHDKDLRAAPFAVHRVGTRWVPDSPPAPARGAQVLSAVDVDPGGGVWAVGMAVDTRPSRTALIWQHTARGWKRHANLPVGRSTALSGVLARSATDVWAVGSEGGAHGIRPLLLHWNGRAWRVRRIHATSDEAVLSGIAAGPDGRVWAVGWDRVGDSLRPLVLRLTDGGWVDVGGPDVGGAFSLGADLSVDGDGRPWVVGAVYRAASDRYVPIAARLDGEGWTVWPRPPGTGRYLNAVSGDLVGSGWATGRAAVGTIRLSACEPAAGTATAGRHAGAMAKGTRTDEEPASDRAPRPVQGLRRVAGLGPPRPLAGITARDVAVDAGIDVRGFTHGATVADLDGDGRRDLFVSGHGGQALMFLRRDGGYVRQRRLLPHNDRHDCDVLKVDTGPLADIICSVGSDHGLGIKANELWIDPASGVATDEAAIRGIADPVGRGREIATFDADGDGDQDLFLGNLGLRYDGQPTPNRLLLNDGTGHFSWHPDSGLTSDRGAWCAVPVDADLDHDTDLLMCGRTGDVIDVARIVLYRNDGTGDFTDVTSASGIRPIGEVDAEMAQLGGSGRPDLVQLSVDRIRISLWREGGYRKVYERKVTHGRSLAVGDVNGDGAIDIYVQMGSPKVNDPDVVLVNGGTGRTWAPMAIPSTSAGTAEDVVALDHDGNGLTDFLVLNGWQRAGPIELIAFTRSGPTNAGR